MNQDSVYAIGDIQGCLESLEGLLEQLPADASLLFVGDLVNRGPESLATLRFIKSLGSRVEVTLGNHDLHLLACAAGAGRVHKKDTIGEILEAPDGEELVDWLRRRPLLVERCGTVFAHAGLNPNWTLDEARALAAEAHEALSGGNWKTWLQGMYGNTGWAGELTGPARMRAILNAFTRMRFVDRTTGELDFEQKEDVGSAPAHLVPWFDFEGRCERNVTVCFGHWSMLGLINRPDVVAIDTGCLWGGRLTAVRFPDRRFFEEPCPCWADPFAFKKKQRSARRKTPVA